MQTRQVSVLVWGLLVSNWQRSIDSWGHLVSCWQRWLTDRFARWAPKQPALTLGHGSEAMSALECLHWRNFNQTSDDLVGTEGKNGVPRYDGEAAKLAEYSFRVKMMEARTAAMDQTEAKKLGPLGLRLIEGLRGQALQVAKGLDVKKLATDDGPTLLVDTLYKAFKPRRDQEARELYNAGAQTNGVLSRQPTESMTSFCLRRRTWYAMLRDLDDSLQLPDNLLAEQTLVCAGLNYDHQLMIRTALQGRITVNSVMDELIAQHSRIHEIEARRGGDFSHGRGRGKAIATPLDCRNPGSHTTLKMMENGMENHGTTHRNRWVAMRMKPNPATMDRR